MNRLASAPTATSVSDLLPTNAVETALLQSLPNDGPRLYEPEAPLACFMPQHYEAGYAYPLLVWLHDSGCNEECIPQVMQHVSLRNYVAVAPRGSEECLQSVSDSTFDWSQSLEGIGDAETAIDDAIDRACERFHVSSKNIFIAGYGAGGSMALRVALRRPAKFAGVASLGGAMPSGHSPLRAVQFVKSLPMLLASGREGSRYGESQACRDLRLLHSAGCELSVRQYPTDELTDNMLGDLNAWMMNIVCENKQ